MSEVRKIRVKSRLSKFISTPGGVNVGRALARANEAVEALRAPCLANIDMRLAEIDSRFGVAGSSRSAENIEELYDLAAQIIDVSICLNGSGIDLAARALCELVDVSQMVGVCDWDAIGVHIEALKMLRVEGLTMPAESRRAVLAGLAKVTRKRVGDPNAPLQTH